MISITDYADIINCEIIVTYYHNQNNRWSARFEHAEIKESKSSGVLISEFGNGKTPKIALENYITSIKGKVLVLDATGGDKRREFVVPSNLTMMEE